MYADYGGPMSETPIVQKGLAALPEPVKGAVITVSDRCVSGEREDLSGPLAQRLLAEHDVVVEKVDLVPDGVEPVREAIRRAVSAGARVVLTTGGTGVTPETSPRRPRRHYWRPASRASRRRSAPTG